MKARPLALAYMGNVVAMIVPLLARAVGNYDLTENSIVHVFGQATLCAAMDYPGWLEAAAFGFFVAGLMWSVGAYQVISFVKKTSPRHKFLNALLAFMVLASMSFLSVGFSNPTSDPDDVSVAIQHSVPYVVLQVAGVVWRVFLIVYFQPARVLFGVKLLWNVCAVLHAVCLAFQVIIFVISLHEMNTLGEKLTETEHEFPYDRLSFMQWMEYPFVVSGLLVAFAHPTTWRGLETNGASAGQAAKGDAAVYGVEADAV